jgi:peroxiredoxin
VGGSLAAISVDPKDESVKMAQELGLHMPLLSDPDLAVAKAYGVAMEGRDIAVPSVFVVRKDRTIAWSQVGENMTDRASPQAIVDQVRSAAK